MKTKKEKKQLLDELNQLREQTSKLVKDHKDQNDKINQLVETNHLLSIIIDNLPGMAYISSNDKNRTIQFVSSGCYELTGYKPVDLIGNMEHSFYKIIFPEDQDYVMDAIHKAIELKEGFEVHYRIITSNGDQKWVSDQGQGIYTDGGKLISIEGFVTEIQ